MKTFEEFCNYVERHILECLPPEYANAEIKLKPVNKSAGEELTGISIKKEDETIVPNIYLNGFYEKYRNANSLEDVLWDIANTRIKNDNTFRLEDVPTFESFDEIKDRVIMRVNNARVGEKYLEDTPHETVFDLGVVYGVNIAGSDGDSGFIKITDSILNRLGIDQETLHEYAEKNTAEKATYKTLGDVLAEMMGDANLPDDIFTDPPVYVLTNQEKVYGAAAIACPSTLKDIASKTQEDYYILPSSVHEILIVPISLNANADDLLQMVHSVNATEVDPRDYLSDNVYYYSAEREKLFLANPEFEPEKGASDLSTEAGECDDPEL